MLMRRGASAGDEVGKLEGIGGRADESDVLREELLREVREEIGDEVEIEVVDFLELKSDRVLKAMADGSPIWKTWIIASYICKLVAGRPDIREPDKNEGFEYFSDLQLVDPRRLSSSCQQSLASLRASWPRLAPLLNA
jgi:hypothetical protein